MARANGKDRGIFERPKGSGSWWIRYHDQYGREHREKVGTKSQARAAYEARKTEVRQEKFDPDAAGRRRPQLLVGDFIKDYLDATRDVLLDSKKNAALGKMWASHFAGRTLAEIQPQDIDQWRTRRLRSGAAPATVNRAVAFLKRVYNVAMRDGKCPSNPLARLRMLRENNARVRYLTEEEERRLLDALPTRFAPLVQVAIGTGMRVSEQVNLRWEHVDFRNEVITIPRSKHGEKRHVPMSEEVAALLRALPSRLKSEWVFPTPGGDRPLSRFGSLRGAFKKAVARAEVADFHWHDLRHSFASRLAMAGVDLLTIKELMGHKTLAMVQRYAHLSPNHLRQAVGKIRIQSTRPAGTAGEAPAPVPEPVLVRA